MLEILGFRKIHVQPIALRPVRRYSGWTVPQTPIRLTPQPCPNCGADSHYVVQLPLLNDTVDLAWFCRACRHEWPVTRRDVGETAPLSKS